MLLHLRLPGKEWKKPPPGLYHCLSPRCQQPHWQPIGEFTTLAMAGSGDKVLLPFCATCGQGFPRNPRAIAHVQSLSLDISKRLTLEDIPVAVATPFDGDFMEEVREQLGGMQGFLVAEPTPEEEFHRVGPTFTFSERDALLLGRNFLEAKGGALRPGPEPEGEEAPG